MKQLLAALFLIVVVQVNAQTSKMVIGSVVDSLQQLPLQGATVTLVDANGVKINSTSTDAKGFFQLITERKRLKELIISFTGFQTKKYCSLTMNWHMNINLVHSISIPMHLRWPK